MLADWSLALQGGPTCSASRMPKALSPCCSLDSASVAPADGLDDAASSSVRVYLCPRADHGTTAATCRTMAESTHALERWPFTMSWDCSIFALLAAACRGTRARAKRRDGYARQGEHLKRPTSLASPSRRCQSSHSHIDLAPEWVGQHRQTGSLPPFWVLTEPSHSHSVRLP